MRIRKGQTVEEAFPQPSTSSPPSLSSIDSPFQLEEYLSLLIRQDPHDVERIVSLPEGEFTSNPNAAFSPSNNIKGKARDKQSGSTAFDPEGINMPEEELQPVDTDVWVYEQLRRIVLDFSHPWLVQLQQVCSPKLSPSTCSAMYAGDWMYLCACHGEEKQCCAIDYMIHTIDGTSALLNSARHFPSRTFIPNTSLRHFGSIARRLSRVFVHAWGHHRETFANCEADTSLYARFYSLVEKYDLVPLKDLPPKHAHQNPSLDPRNPSSSSDEFSSREIEIKSNPVLLSKSSSSSSSSADNHRNDSDGISRMILKRPSAEKESNGNPDHQSSSGADLGRSDSNASRITVVRIDGKKTQDSESDLDSVGEDRDENLSSGAGDQGLRKEEMPKDSTSTLETERRQLSPGEAPTEVKDEDEEDEEEGEEGREGREGGEGEQNEQEEIGAEGKAGQEGDSNQESEALDSSQSKEEQENR